MSDRRTASSEISEQERNRLVAWEMEYSHPLELDADLRDAYDAVNGGGPSMMVTASFDHANGQLGTARTDPAATGAPPPTSFELSDGTEILYAPGDPDYHEVIERQTASSPSARGPTVGPG